MNLARPIAQKITITSVIVLLFLIVYYEYTIYCSGQYIISILFIVQVRQRFLYWKQCVTETIRHRCLEEVHSDPSRVVQVQEPCTT